jgi:hypothetical protein
MRPIFGEFRPFIYVKQKSNEIFCDICCYFHGKWEQKWTVPTEFQHVENSDQFSAFVTLAVFRRIIGSLLIRATDDHLSAV